MASEFLWVAQQVLEKEGRPMGPKEIVDYAIHHSLFSHNIAGKTPHQTMKSKLSVDVKRRGEHSLFVRTHPGKFFLRALLADPNSVYTAPPIRRLPSHEHVLVFRSSHLHDRSSVQGLSTSWKQLRHRLLKPTVCTHIPRVDAEQTEDFKQILSYILVCRGSEILAYQRGNYNRVEDFLRGSYCVGFGGHISQNDLTFFSEDMGLTDGTIRELNEELALPPEDKRRLKEGSGLSCIGVINDDSSEAGRKHFAFVFRYDVSDATAWDIPARGEKSITKLQWLRPEAPLLPIWNFEYWSQLCLRQFFPSVISTAPAYRLLRRTSLAPPNILCVVGEVGCGKSEATRILVNRFNYHAINSGHYIASLLGLPPIPETPREQFQAKAWAFIKRKRGPEQLAGHLGAAIAKLDHCRILIDGIRQRSTLECLRRLVRPRKVGVLYVHTLPDVAYEFFKQRERSGIPVFDFLRIRSAEVEQDVRGLLSLADGVLYNWGSLADYRRTTGAMVSDLLGSER